MIKKDQKKQIEELAQLLNQAHGEIEAAIDSQERAMALQLLEDCQESAICLGELIEREEGEGFVTVSLLEEYCELIFQLHEQLNDQLEQGPNVIVDANNAFKPLHEALAKIQSSIAKDIKVRKEAVFLPYKASMWDSLESVWKAADEDPDYDAYVIPIPYYDKKPDGNLGQLHYEGNQFPSYVPITGYREYDLEKRRPDIIFLHNPYDDYNRVTSVYPTFYTRDLKEYTRQLVYIPYFVLEEVNPKDKEKIKPIAHFCCSPGVVNADRVFVQSENLRQVYINVLTEQYGPNTKDQWKSKIYGTGSPKIDKVLCDNKSDQVLPPQWLNIIQKPDGTNKRIILYNTSITDLLESRQKMLDKMREVFRIFRENQAEIALLWRPHPLIGATLNSMLPQLGAEYQKLVEAYRAEGFGIYDDTPDMNRALSLCDAYYGDRSSLTLLCRKAGKVVMLQNVEIIPDENINSENENAQHNNMAALLEQMPDKPYVENASVNLYSLFELPAASISQTDDVHLCGPEIWKQSKQELTSTKK